MSNALIMKIIGDFKYPSHISYLFRYSDKFE